LSHTLSFREDPPPAYFDPPTEPPAATPVLSTELAASGDPSLTLDAVWQRIEAWIAFRWGERSAVFIVEGPGEWLPDAAPFVASTIERWEDGAWIAATPDPTPLGGWLLDGFQYRLAGTLGSADEPPAAVQAAAIRLARFLAARDGLTPRPGTTEHSIGAGVTIGAKAPAARVAKAIHYSGAADLLRPYRQVHQNS